MRKLLYVLAFLPLFSTLSAQIEFENTSEEVLRDAFNGILPIAVGDLNGDFKDDIAFFPDGDYLRIGFQLSDGAFYFEDYGEKPDNLGGVWSMAIADLDEDGFNELIVGLGRSMVVYKNELETNKMTLVLSGEEVFSQNISVADYNMDGVLDIFVCNDVGYNKIFNYSESNGLEVNKELSDNIAYVGGANYGSAFSDIDNDCDLDLYLAKCKQGETDPTSPDRINLLYNNINGELIEEMGDRGVSINSQSWTGTFGDLDNDLDLDLIVTNHSEENMIMLNDGSGNFTLAQTMGFRTTDFPLQSILRDFDNNGYLDIFVTGTESAIFLNNGDLNFQELDMDVFRYDILSAAAGDFNSDGFLDIFASYGQVFNLTSNRPDQIFYNKGNDNNFIGFDLIGAENGINAIGAKVYVHTGNDTYLRELAVGDSYGINNSLKVHFGIGEASVVDSVVVKWPSMQTDVFLDLDINVYHVLSEECGERETVDLLDTDDYMVICDNEVLELRGPDGNHSFLWSTGETTQTIRVGESGHIQLFITDDSNCIIKSKTIIVGKNPPIDTRLFSDFEGVRTFCKGDTVEICAIDPNLSYQWTNNNQERCIRVSESGSYSAILTNKCGSTQSESIEINVLEYAKPILDSFNYVNSSGTVSVYASGDNLLWYSDESLTNEIGDGDMIELFDVYTDTFVYCTAMGTFEAEILDGGKLDTLGPGGENRRNFQGLMNFDVYIPFTLKSVDVYCYEPSTVYFRINTIFNEFLIFDEINLEVGWNTIELDLYLPRDNNYTMTLQGDPNSYRNFGDVNYPYEIGEGHGSITSGGFTDSEYFYFYNWKIQEYVLDCSSVERFNLPVITSNDEELTSNFKLLPNPVTDVLVVQTKGGQDQSIEIYDVNGRLITKSTFDGRNTLEIDCSGFIPGVFMLKMRDNKTGVSATKSFVKK